MSCPVDSVCRPSLATDARSPDRGAPDRFLLVAPRWVGTRFTHRGAVTDVWLRVRTPFRGHAAGCGNVDTEVWFAAALSCCRIALARPSDVGLLASRPAGSFAVRLVRPVPPPSGGGVGSSDVLSGGVGTTHEWQLGYVPTAGSVLLASNCFGAIRFI